MNTYYFIMLYCYYRKIVILTDSTISIISLGSSAFLRSSSLHYIDTFPVNFESRSSVCTRRLAHRMMRTRYVTSNRKTSVHVHGWPLFILLQILAVHFCSAIAPAFLPSRLIRLFFRCCACLYFTIQWRHIANAHRNIFYIAICEELFLPDLATCSTAGNNDGRLRRCPMMAL